jgi:hypothetical protein
VERTHKLPGSIWQCVFSSKKKEEEIYIYGGGNTGASGSLPDENFSFVSTISFRPEAGVEHQPGVE